MDCDLKFIFESYDPIKILEEIFKVKQKEENLSYYKISKWLGLKSTNYFNLILKGRKRLTPEMANKLSIALDLSPKESMYIENLVRFRRSKSFKERLHYFERVNSIGSEFSMKHRKMRENAKLLKNTLALILFEILLTQKKKRWNIQEIITSLRSNYSTKIIKEALSSLADCGFIGKDKNLYYSKKDYLEFDSEDENPYIQDFHIKSLEDAKNNIINCPPDERHCTTFAITIESELNTFQKVKDHLDDSITNNLNEYFNPTRNSKNKKAYLMTYVFYPVTNELKCK